jgi:Ca2+-binding EF-hand superfamily protein
LTGDKTRVNQSYLEQKFKTLDRNGDLYVSIGDYISVLTEEPDFFDWYDLFNNGGTPSIEKERELLKLESW